MVLFHNAVNRRQPQSGPLALPFGGEEWLEDAALGLLRHAMARVGDGDGNVSARLHIELRFGAILA